MAGPIQGDINQALGTLGALATFSPQLQEHAENMAENRNLNKRQKVLDEQAKIAEQDLKNKTTPNANGDIIIDAQTASEIQQSRREQMRQNQEQEDISRRRYDLKPTLENYQKWQTDASINQNARDEYANIEKQEKSMGRVGRLQEAKKTQKRNFMDYLSQQSTSLGGTVGELPKPLQKQIASQYTKSQRKTMMDRMDREANNGKQE